MLISGIITAAGVAPWLALLLWKPVAVLATFMAMRALAHRMLPSTGQRRAAILLGLFFASFSSVFGQLGVVGDMIPGWLTWGYPFGLIAVALIIFALIGYDRARTENRVVWAPGLLAGLSATCIPGRARRSSCCW